MNGITFEQLRDLIPAGRPGVSDAPCPLCGPDRRSSTNQRRKILRLWCDDPSFISYHCARCGERGWASNSSGVRPSPPSRDNTAIKQEINRRNLEEARDRLKIALSLWRRRIPISGTLAETYLRGARCYDGRLPGTLGFLAASGDYAPAMVAAFGTARETTPGNLVIDDALVSGGHLQTSRPMAAARPVPTATSS